MNPTTHQNTALKPNETWNYLWKIPLPQKVLQFIWKILHLDLPVRTILIQRGINCEDSCPLYINDKESLDHLFLHCPFSRAVWLGSELTVKIDTLPFNSATEWIAKWLQGSHKEPKIRYSLPSLFVISGVFGLTGMPSTSKADNQMSIKLC